MKLNKLTRSIISIMCIPCIYAASNSFGTEFEVSSATEFSTAWANASAGDSIILTSDIDLGSIADLEIKEGGITISSQNDEQYSIVWIEGTNNTNLPNAMELSDLKITGAPATLFVIDSSLIVGDNNIFSNNGDLVGLGGGVFHVNEGASLSIGSNNTFEYCSSTGGGGVIYLANNTTSTGNYSLQLNASTGDIIFSNNSCGDWSFSNDIYFGTNTSALVYAAEGYSVEFNSGISSADDSAVIDKTGDGDLSVNTNSFFYLGDVNVLEGSFTLNDDTNWYGSQISVSEGASLVLGLNAWVDSEIELNGGSIVVQTATPKSTFTGINGTITLTESSSISFILSEESILDQGSNALLNISSITTTSDAYTLTTNLDFSQLTSYDSSESLLPYNYSSLDSDSQDIISNGTISITDRTGSYEIDASTVMDATTGAIDITALIEQITFDRPGSAVANATWTSAGSLDTLWRSAIQSQLNMGQSKQNALWVSGLASYSSMDAQGDRPGYSYSGGGYALGYNYLMSSRANLGFSLGQMIGSNDADGGINSDANSSIDQNTLMLGFYGRFKLCNCNEAAKPSNIWYLDAYIGFGETDNDLSQDGQKGSWDDHVFATYAHISYAIMLQDNTTLSPYTGLEYLTARQDNFTTSGAKSLHYQGGNSNVLRLPIGISIAKTSDLGQGSITPSLSLAYYADIVQDAASNIVTDSAGTSWTSKAVTPGRNGFQLRAAVQMRHNERWSSYASYTLDAASDTSNHSFGAGVQYQF